MAPGGGQDTRGEAARHGGPIRSPEQAELERPREGHEVGRGRLLATVERDGHRDQVQRRQMELADIQAGVIAGFDQIERGEFAEGTGEEAIERAFTKAVEKRGL